jgi:hypothetical protein
VGRDDVRLAVGEAQAFGQQLDCFTGFEVGLGGRASYEPERSSTANGTLIGGSLANAEAA